MPRFTWKGTLRLSLVSVPIQAINAEVSGGGEIHLNQLHETCHSRIRYKKTCPLHGEVPKDEIVLGYEYAKDQYVIVDPEELDQLRTETERAIHIDTFIAPDDLDPMYLDGRSYYLVPDGPAGQKPFAVLHRAMTDRGQWAIGQGVFSGKEQLMVVRPVESLFVASMLKYPQQLRDRDDLDDTTDQKVNKQELKLAEMLIDASSSDHFDLNKYEDEYTKKLTALIEAKVEGREIVVPPEEEPVRVINLMDALKRSVESAKGAKASRRKPAKHAAPTRRKKLAGAR